MLAYDYTVLAGTQGGNNHWKLDRMSELAARWRLPMVFFTEGGGGRPGDTEGGGFTRGFEFWGKLSRRRAAGRASTPAAASPATPRSSAAAT